MNKRDELEYNKNLLYLIDSYEEGKRGVVLEGGSRSGKTWSCIDFLVGLCAENVNAGYVIFLIKDTYNGFKTTLYNDFNQRFPDYPGLKSPFASVKEVQSFELFGNKIQMLGADKPDKFQSAGCDFFYINEAMPIKKESFRQLEMRCRKFWWMDLNPNATDHWIFDLEKRPNVGFCRSTMLDNPAVPPQQKETIFSYDPNNPVNIENGTADDYLWAVYGLGLRSSPQGLIFKNIRWISTFPDDVERIWYGLDFGFTNDPTALVRIAVKGNDVFAEELLYIPVESADLLIEIVRPIIYRDVMWCDASDKNIGVKGADGMVKDLQRAGLRAYKAKKYPGSVQFGIDVMKRYRLNIVKTTNFVKEADNYKWREIGGVPLNVPIDNYNHLWDALRYGCQMELSKRKGFTV